MRMTASLGPTMVAVRPRMREKTMATTAMFRAWVGATLAVILAAAGGALVFLPPQSAEAEPKQRVTIPKDRIVFDDGDSIAIRWPERLESVRILGIDTPEVQHLEHQLPYDQPFGREAAGFLRGCLAVAEKVELLRSGSADKYGRTLGYLFLDGKNYSVLAIRARLAYGPSDRFGDNGLPTEHAACKAAAKDAGPPPFEEPYKFRGRMREVSKWMKAKGTYPACPPKDK